MAIPVVENSHVFQETCENGHSSVVSKVGNKRPLTGEWANKSGVLRYRAVAVLGVKALSYFSTVHVRPLERKGKGTCLQGSTTDT